MPKTAPMILVLLQPVTYKRATQISLEGTQHIELLEPHKHFHYFLSFVFSVDRYLSKQRERVHSEILEKKR